MYNCTVNSFMTAHQAKGNTIRTVTTKIDPKLTKKTPFVQNPTLQVVGNFVKLNSFVTNNQSDRKATKRYTFHVMIIQSDCKASKLHSARVFSSYKNDEDKFWSSEPLLLWSVENSYKNDSRGIFNHKETIFNVSHTHYDVLWPLFSNHVAYLRRKLPLNISLFTDI